MCEKSATLEFDGNVNEVRDYLGRNMKRSLYGNTLKLKAGGGVIYIVNAK